MWKDTNFKKKHGFPKFSFKAEFLNFRDISTFFFFFNFIYLLIYLWLCWVFVSV